MQRSFTKKYFQIYFWQGLAILLSFVSMFIVIPRISNVKEIYGIYSICISLNIFLSYADIGFLSAGFKYVSEIIAVKDRKQEVQITGFVGFILLLMLFPFIAIIIFLSFHPGFLIKNLTDPEQVRIASRLLVILAIFSPTTLLNRTATMIFGPRVEDYIPRRISIGANLVTISSVFYFFRSGSYDIVGYFFFMNLMNFFAGAVSLLVARARYGYSMVGLIKAFHFSREVYRKIKNLAFTSFYGTVCQILYYELDLIAIAKLLGADQVAVYSACLIFFNFLRSIYGTLFSPFSARFNHFIGAGDDAGLKKLLSSVLKITIPLTVLPMLALFMLMRPFILSWLGPAYEASVGIGSILVLIYSFGFIHYPGSILMQAQERYKWMNILATLNVLLFWTGIIFTLPYFGVRSFAAFKLLTFITASVIYLANILKFLQTGILKFVRDYLLPVVIPALILAAAFYIILPFLPIVKNKTGLFLTIAVGGGATGAGVLIYSIFSKDFRDYALTLIRHLPFLKKKNAA